MSSDDDLMTVQWFGAAPFARVCEDDNQAVRPGGQPCAWCGEPIGETDNGFLIAHLDEHGATYKPWHHECSIRSIAGSVRHQLRKCSCFGNGGPACDEPVGMSKRQEAKLAAEIWIETQGQFHRVIAEAMDAIHLGREDDD